MHRLADGSVIDDWRWRPPEPQVFVEELPDPAVVLADRIVTAVAELKSALQALPTPQIHIEKPDLAEVVTAVTAALPTSIDADDLADAVARKFNLPEPVSNEPLVAAIKEAFEKMDHRLMGMPAFGASGPSNISDNANRQLGVVSWTSPRQSGDGESISAAGSNTLHTPASGKKIRLRWIYLQATTGAVTATVKLGTSTLYVVSLSPNGVPVFSHSTSREGAADDTLTVTLDVAETVLTNFDLEEI